MVPVAQADRQAAPTFIRLKVVLVALENLGLGDAGAKRCIIQGCGDGSIPYQHEGAHTPSGFWHGHLSNFTFDGSDITNAVGDEIYAFTLPNVSLSWEALTLKYPELDAEPPRLDTSRVEVAATPSFMRWLETLVTRLRRKPRPSAAASAFSQGTERIVQTDPTPQLTRLEEMERAKFFRGAHALQDAADYTRARYGGCVPDDVTPAEFARGLEGWLKERDKVKAVPGQWQTSNRFLQEYRRRP